MGHLSLSTRIYDSISWHPLYNVSIHHGKIDDTSATDERTDPRRRGLTHRWKDGLTDKRTISRTQGRYHGWKRWTHGRKDGITDEERTDSRIDGKRRNGWCRETLDVVMFDDLHGFISYWCIVVSGWTENSLLGGSTSDELRFNLWPHARTHKHTHAHTHDVISVFL